MNAEHEGPGSAVPPMGLLHGFLIFGGGALLLGLGTRLVIPAVSQGTALEPVVAWFLVGGLLVFLPILLFGLFLLRQEGWGSVAGLWSARLRFRRMNRTDWAWGIGALIVIGLLTGLIQVLMGLFLEDADLHPPFMAFEPLGPGRYWILGAWLPFWVMNIMGEEIVWRGVILPRQEVALGAHAWMANAGGWLIFHLAFGWQLLLLLTPIVVVLPYVAQKRKNSWIAVLIHGGLNGPAFVAIALGLL
jgi:membrane protease YdiL (CAAX protease family)